jgi:hypothetical protein
MIKIIIEVKEGKVFEDIEREKSTLTEVSLALFRLKQIEQSLIDMDFIEIFKIETEDKE